jgi:hypothetical protein
LNSSPATEVAGSSVTKSHLIGAGLNAVVKTLAVVLLGSAVLMGAASGRQRSEVQLDLIAYACMGQISMTVRVNVDGEQFTFQPYCRAGFLERFTIKKNRVTCEIGSVMCSRSSSPTGIIGVECEDGRTSGHLINCPTRN